MSIRGRVEWGFFFGAASVGETTNAYINSNRAEVGWTCITEY